MNIIKLLPVIFSFIVLSAHFSRANMPFFSILFLLIPLLLFIKKRWAVRTIQILLIFGSAEWIRILFVYTNERQAIGAPYVRLVIILGIVALITGLSALIFRNPAIKDRYIL